MHIMTEGLGTRAVTISALIIQAAVALQTIPCASMLAVVALEGGQIMLRHAAAASSIRYVNSGAHNLLLLLTGGRLRHKLVTGFLVSTIFITTMLLQFSLTVLLFDI